MITLSEAVLDELKRLRGRTERTFRIEPGCSCCHSPTLELILDEPEYNYASCPIGRSRKFPVLRFASESVCWISSATSALKPIMRKDTVYSRNGPSLPLSKTDAFALHSTSIPKGPEMFPALSVYPPKRVLLDTRAGSSMKIPLPHILPPEPIPRVTPAQR